MAFVHTAEAPRRKRRSGMKPEVVFLKHILDEIDFILAATYRVIG